MAFASGGPGAHPSGAAPGAQAAMGGANAAGPSWANLLDVAHQALQQIGLPGGLYGTGGQSGGGQMPQQTGMMPPQLSYMMNQSPYNMTRPY